MSIGNLPKVPPLIYKADQRNLATSLDAAIRNINAILGDVQKLDSNVTEVTRTIVSISESQNPTYSTPEALTDLIADPLFQSVVLSWTAGVIEGFAYFEVHRSADDNLANAVRVGIAQTTLFYDAVEEGQTYYYWVRTVNQNNVAGPFNSANGTPATTAISATTLLNALVDKIQASHLHSSLSSRIDLIDATGTGLLERLGIVEGDLYDPTDGIAAVLTELADVVYDPTTGLATRASVSAVSSLSSAVNHPTSGLLARALQTDLAELSTTVEGKASATELNQLSAQVSDPTTGLNTKASQSSLATLTAEVDGKAEATVVNQLSTTVDNHTATIDQHQSSIDGLSAEYVIKTDVNGRVVGYGIYNSGTTASFEILAPVFTVWDPDLNQYVIGTSGGSTFIQGAYIANATIDAASIKDVLAEQIVSGSLLSGTWIKGGDYFGGQLRLGLGTIQRANEYGTNNGYSFVVDDDGTVEMEGSLSIKTSSTGSRIEISSDANRVSFLNSSSVEQVRIGVDEFGYELMCIGESYLGSAAAASFSLASSRGGNAVFSIWDSTQFPVYEITFQAHNIGINTATRFRFNKDIRSDGKIYAVGDIESGNNVYSQGVRLARINELPSTSNLVNRNYNSIGSMCFVRVAYSDAVAPGADVAGSWLSPASMGSDTGLALSGTWRLLGHILQGASSSRKTLAVRIA